MGDRLEVFCESKRISSRARGARRAGRRARERQRRARVRRRQRRRRASPRSSTGRSTARSHESTAEDAVDLAAADRRRQARLARLARRRGRDRRARLYELVGDVAAILVLPAGARTFKREWAARDPARRDASALCHDADEDGDAGRREGREDHRRPDGARAAARSRAATGATGTAAATSSSSSPRRTRRAALRVLDARRLPRAPVPEGRAAARRAGRDLPRARLAAHGLRRRRLRQVDLDDRRRSRTWPPASTGSASRCRGRCASASSRTRARRASSSRSSRRRSRAGTGPTSRTTCSSSQGPWGEFTFADPEAREALVAFCDEHADRRRHREPDARPRRRRVRPARRDAAVRRLARRVRAQDASAPSGSSTTRTRPARSPATGAATPTRRCAAAGRQPAAHEARLGEDALGDAADGDDRRRCACSSGSSRRRATRVTELDTVGASDTELEQRIVDYLAEHPLSSTTTVETDVKGTASRIRKLLDGARFDCVDGKRGAKLWLLDRDPVGVGRRRGDGVNPQTRTSKGFAPRRHPVENGAKTWLTPSSVVPRKGRRGQPTGSTERRRSCASGSPTRTRCCPAATCASSASSGAASTPSSAPAPIVLPGYSRPLIRVGRLPRVAGEADVRGPGDEGERPARCEDRRPRKARVRGGGVTTRRTRNELNEAAISPSRTRTPEEPSRNRAFGALRVSPAYHGRLIS